MRALFAMAVTFPVSGGYVPFMGIAGESMTTVDRRLATFTGAGYEKGRGLLWQATWFACMNLIIVKWSCPAALRTRLLAAFGAQIGEGVLIRHRVRMLWPWKLAIG